MPERIIIQAPAKINLHLEVRGRRRDGFHDILSIFQMISICDTMEIRSLTDTEDCRIEGGFDFPIENNTIYKAWKLFHDAFGIRSGIAVTIEKRIPQGAGLGGGSADAGAALRAFRDLFSVRVADAALAEIGAKVGSDVPFFCLSPTALVSGRGETLAALETRTDYCLVVVVPDFSISTADAYRWIDESRASAYEGEAETDIQKRYNEHREEVIKSYGSAGPESWFFVNTFAEVLAPRFPVYPRIFGKMKEFGALYWNISGSGSSCYAIFTDREKARALYEHTSQEFRTVELAIPLARMPQAIVQ
jgi:4-diphosphocytidyl-2-C-methyl-D-erythritol kinase